MKLLKIKALSLALGVTMAITTLFLGWVAMFGWGTYLVDVISSFYIGYNASFFGGIIGAIWGFVEGAVVGALLGFFFEYFSHEKRSRR
jgi:hypothetical protein